MLRSADHKLRLRAGVAAAPGSGRTPSEGSPGRSSGITDARQVAVAGVLIALELSPG